MQMGLRVICAGWSRTGTFSLKRALERLGVGRCYHMHELFAHPEHVPIWEGAASGAETDWDRLFDGYAAAGDAPACLFWRQLSEHYPEAKIVLTVREPLDWHESMSRTVVEVMRNPSLIPGATAQDILTAVRRLVLDGFFGGKFDDAEEATRRFRAHSDEIRATIDPARLLIYEVSQGWAPLCAFLELPVPDEPFPVTNERDAFRVRAGLSQPVAGRD
jgi:hypothetical protein